MLPSLAETARLDTEEPPLPGRLFPFLARLITPISFQKIVTLTANGTSIKWP